MNLRKVFPKAAIYTAIFAIAIGILLFIGGTSYKQLISLTANERLARHSQDIHIALERLFSQLKDAETGQRGYIITKDSLYLSNYLNSDELVTSAIDSLKKMMLDNSAQKQQLIQLEELINQRLSTLRISLSLSENAPPISDTLRQNMKKGQMEMDEIRARINEMMEHEIKLFHLRKNQYLADIQITPVSYLFLILFAIAIFTFSFFKINRDLRINRSTTKNLERAINELSFQNVVFTHAEESAKTGNFIWNESSGIIKCSANLLHMLDIDPATSDPTPQQLLSMVHPEDKTLVDEHLEQIFATKNIARKTIRMITASGKNKFFRTSGKFLNENGHLILVGNLQDITADIVLNEKLRTTHRDLKRSEVRQDQMISEIEDYAIIYLSKEGLIEKWNKGAEKIKGYKEEEIIGKSISIFYSRQDQEDQLPQILLEEARTKGRVSQEGWRIRKDGSRFWGLVVITALHDEEGRVIGFTKVTRDLTSQKQNEEDQYRYRRSIEIKNSELEKINTELASFNHVASHDLQEPLRKIQTFISRIEDEDFDNLSKMGREYFQRIQNSAKRMQNLIDDLITYSHTSRDQQVWVRVDLDEIMTSVLSEMAPRLEDTKTTIDKDHLPVIMGIPFQMEQLFTNIIDNSLKYKHPERTPRIQIKYHLVDHLNIKDQIITPELKYHQLIFRDNGIGFDNSYAESIFTLFQRLHGKTEYTGTGIGLAICKKITENHKGYIEAEGKPGEGAIFSVYLPVVEIV